MTNAISLVRRLHQHRAWVNGHLLAAASELNAEQLRQRFSIGQGSIWQSLAHLYAAEFVWLAALQGDANPLAPGDVPGQIPGNQLADDRIASLDELKQKWSELEQRWDRYLSTVSPDSLDELVTKRTSSGQSLTTRRSDILLHVCTHAHYTAAQVVNMLRQAGAKKLPETMLISLARHETSGAP